MLPSLEDWNHSNGWKRNYPETHRLVFFAQDLFGNQFGISESDVVSFLPDSGEIRHHSESLETWAAKMLEDFDYETGWSLAQKWQATHGPLPNGYRLLPKIPFVVGGDYAAENLQAVKQDAAMEAYARLYRQIKDVPDGQKVAVSNWI